MSSAAAVVYFLFVVGMGDLPTLTSLAVYPDKETCTAAITTMTPVLAADVKSMELVCVASSDLETLAKASGM